MQHRTPALNKHIVGNSWVSSVNKSTSLSSSAVNFKKSEFLSLVKKPNSVNILIFFPSPSKLSAGGKLLQRGKFLRVAVKIFLVPIFSKYPLSNLKKIALRALLIYSRVRRLSTSHFSILVREKFSE